MIEWRFDGEPGRLIVSEKTGWKSGTTVANQLFVHGGPVDPPTARAWGLTPDRATEFLRHAVDVTDATGKVIHAAGSTISGGKMLFAFYVGDGTAMTVAPEKPAAVGRLWGFDAHSYVFKVPAGTTYWSQNGTVNRAAEVAFEYIVEAADIIQYWAPSKNYISRPGEARDPRRKFLASARF